eukprot:gene1926-biopygen11184
MNSCHEGVRDRNRAGIEAADPKLRVARLKERDRSYSHPLALYEIQFHLLVLTPSWCFMSWLGIAVVESRRLFA